MQSQVPFGFAQDDAFARVEEAVALQAEYRDSSASLGTTFVGGLGSAGFSTGSRVTATEAQVSLGFAQDDAFEGVEEAVALQVEYRDSSASLGMTFVGGLE